MRSLVILSKDQANPEDGTLAPLASRADMLEQLSRRNTGPEIEGGDVVYGPRSGNEVREGFSWSGSVAKRRVSTGYTGLLVIRLLATV